MVVRKEDRVKDADHESVQVCVQRFAAFLRARDELDHVLSRELIETARQDDFEARDRVLALAEACLRHIRERSGWCLNEGEMFPTFERTLHEFTAHMRSVLEEYAKRRADTEPPRDGSIEA